MSTTEEKIAVMQAFVDGKEIQMSDGYGKWFPLTTGNPLWNWASFDYRIKPKQLECWVWRFPSGNLGSTYESKERALELATHCDSEGEPVLMREVL